MKLYFGVLLALVILFNIFYRCYLLYNNSKNRNLILEQRFLCDLFQKVKSTDTASQGHNDEIPINNVNFTQDDFRTEIEKVNWEKLEERLIKIESEEAQ